MCKINISTKVFTETVLFYEQNINIYREILMSQKRKYEIAADAVSKTMSMISKINEELERCRARLKRACPLVGHPYLPPRNP